MVCLFATKSEQDIAAFALMERSLPVEKQHLKSPPSSSRAVSQTRRWRISMTYSTPTCCRSVPQQHRTRHLLRSGLYGWQGCPDNLVLISAVLQHSKAKRRTPGCLRVVPLDRQLAADIAFCEEDLYYCPQSLMAWRGICARPIRFHSVVDFHRNVVCRYRFDVSFMIAAIRSMMR